MAGVIEIRGGTAVTTYAAGVISVTPNNGPLGGGQALTITGANFKANPAVTIGGQACANIVLVNGTSITCDSPALVAGVYDVVVTNNGQSASPPLVNAFTAYAAPTVTVLKVAGVPITDGPAAGGQAIEVWGTGFLNLGAGPSITIAGVACTSVEYTLSTVLTCVTGAHAAGGPFNVVVTNADAATQSGTGVALYSYV